MHRTGAKEKIHSAMMECEGIHFGQHSYGGTEYHLGKREIGHVHGDKLVDIPFPLKTRNELVQKGEAEVHHVLPESGWVSVYIKEEADVDRAIRLLKLSYSLAVEQNKKRSSKN